MSKPKEPRAGEKLTAAERQNIRGLSLLDALQSLARENSQWSFHDPTSRGQIADAGDPAVLQELGTLLNGSKWAQRGLLLHASSILRPEL